jgi:hypothetical protein
VSKTLLKKRCSDVFIVRQRSHALDQNASSLFRDFGDQAITFAGATKTDRLGIERPSAGYETP